MAVDFALAHPDMVKALVLVVGVVGGWDPPPDFEKRVRPYHEIAGKSPEAIADLWLTNPYWIPAPENPEARRKFRTIVVESFQTPLAPSLPADSLSPPAIERLAEIYMPTLIVVGALDDPEIIKVAAMLTQKIAGARLVTIAKAGHFPHLEQPIEFNRAVLNFLSSARK